MNTFIIIEGPSNGIHLKRLTQREFGELPMTRFFAPSAKRAVESLGRSLLLENPDGCVVAVLNAEPVDAKSEYGWLVQALDEVAHPARWRAFVLVPSFDQLLRDELDLAPDTELGPVIDQLDPAQLQRLAASPQLRPILSAIREAARAAA